MRTITKGLLAVAAAATLGLGGVAKAASISFGGYTGPISIHITAFDEGVLYQRNATTNAGVSGTSNVNGLTQTGTPTGAVAGEDTWGIFLIDQIISNDGNNTVLYDRTTSSSILTGLVWGGHDVGVSTANRNTTDGPDSETVDTNGSEIAVFQNTSVGFNATTFGNLGPGIRVNAIPNAPVYAGATDGSLLWSFNVVDNTQSSTSYGNFSGSPFPNANTKVKNGSGSFEAVTGTTGWGTGPDNNVFGPLDDGNNLVANFSFSSQELKRGQNAGWTVGAKDPIDATLVPLPTSAAMGGMIIAGMMGMAVKRRRSMHD